MPIYKEELASLKRCGIHTQHRGCWMDMCVHCSTVRFTGVRVCACTYVCMYIHTYVRMSSLIAVGVCCTCRQTHSSELPVMCVNLMQ